MTPVLHLPHEEKDIHLSRISQITPPITARWPIFMPRAYFFKPGDVEAPLFNGIGGGGNLASPRIGRGDNPVTLHGKIAVPTSYVLLTARSAIPVRTKLQPC